MPHFAHDLLTGDPEAHAQLRAALHREQAAPETVPTLADRFGVPSAAAPQRKPRRRRQTAVAGNLVTS